ncbi:hypothetical protein BDQ12DRAFT_664871 [Crucibulum laeve]|uniref:Uncharacterized protein n=1 Tax=Crucibulum laeve TaxID=68775 RepID=A0A5C3M6A1_9AGAR|nr:hypothetical protein BDQ12DRAFT_664871 [Crucibulum laeve]
MIATLLFSLSYVLLFGHQAMMIYAAPALTIVAVACYMIDVNLLVRSIVLTQSNNIYEESSVIEYTLVLFPWIVFAGIAIEILLPSVPAAVFTAILTIVSLAAVVAIVFEVSIMLAITLGTQKDFLKALIIKRKGQITRELPTN